MPSLTHSQMLSYGCTRLGVGVQSVFEDVARDTNRGHTVKAVSESFQLAKDAGFKVVAHMMPDLPNVGLERDIEGYIVSLYMYIHVYMYLYLGKVVAILDHSSSNTDKYKK